MITFVFMIVAMVAMFAYFNTKNNRKETEELPKEEKYEELLIGQINNIELYVTDYVYDSTINGYKYTKLNVNNADELKALLRDINLNDRVEDVVFGKYKIVLDDKTIFFELDNDSALYLEKKITFKLPNTIKKKIVASMDNCSCCQNTEKCGINVCACKTPTTENQTA